MFTDKNTTTTPFGALSRFGSSTAFGSTLTTRYPVTPTLGSRFGAATGATSSFGAKKGFGTDKWNEIRERFSYRSESPVVPTPLGATNPTAGSCATSSTAAKICKTEQADRRERKICRSSATHPSTSTTAANEVATASIIPKPTTPAAVKENNDSAAPTHDTKGNKGTVMSRLEAKRLKKLDDWMSELHYDLTRTNQRMSAMGYLLTTEAPLHLFEKYRIKEVVQKLTKGSDYEWEALRNRAWEVLERIAKMEGKELAIPDDDSMEEPRRPLKRRCAEEQPMPIKKRPRVIPLITID